jgi:hypothetical protein
MASSEGCHFTRDALTPLGADVYDRNIADCFSAHGTRSVMAGVRLQLEEDSGRSIIQPMHAPTGTGSARHSDSQVAAAGFLFVVFIYLAWICVWLLERWLETRCAWINTHAAQSLYWLGMKILVWVLPGLYVIRYSGSSFRQTVGLDRPGLALGWGFGIGLGLALISVIVKTVTHQKLLSTPISWSLFSAVIVAPVTEEIAFRGAVLPALKTRVSFFAANLITALLFTAAHFPGWYFRHSLLAHLRSPIGGALSVFLLGFVFGWVAHKSKGIAGSTLVHMISNLSYS